MKELKKKIAFFCEYRNQHFCHYFPSRLCNRNLDTFIIAIPAKLYYMILILLFVNIEIA